MRIRRDRPGFSTPDRGTHQERARAFRNSHHVGDVVRGRLTGWEDQGLAWMRLDGQPLLARLPEDTPVGAKLSFVITALTPEIVLKLLPGQTGGSSRGDLAAAFVSARAAFESAAKAALSADAPMTEDRLPAWRDQVAGDAELTGLLARTLACLDRINRTLPDNARLTYPAWLAPWGRDLEMLVRRKERPDEPDFLDLLLAGSLPGCGAFQVRLMALGDKDSMRASVRVLAERREALADRAKGLARTVAEIETGLDASWLGLEPLPKARHGGALVELAWP